MTGAGRLAPLERGLNAALALDPAAERVLAPLTGQVFELRCSRPALTLFLITQGGRITLRERYHGEATASLAGNAEDFLRLWRAGDPAAELINGPLAVHGDSSALITLQKALSQLEPDWEAPLVRLFGDIGGHQLGQSLRAGGRYLRYAGGSLQRQLQDYLLYESELLPGADDIANFCDEVDALRTRTDRLAAKLARLQQRMSRAKKGE